ncbi:MAG: energy-coupling factor transporter ATPase [candidate division WOR-3 bacterium]
MKAIETEGLTISYPDGHKALNDLNLNIDEGEFVVIMGEMGAGKSTLSLALAGLIPKFVRVDYKGEVKILGRRIPEIEKEELIRYVGIVFQDFECQLFSTNVELELAFLPENLGLAQEEIRERCQAISKLFNLTNFEKRNVQTLSGGEKQRLAIASVLVGSPKILILDEPTTDLDPLGKKMIFDLLSKIGGTKILFENEPERALKANRVLIIKEGRIIAAGSPWEVLSNSRLLMDNGIKPLDVNLIFDHLLTVDEAEEYIRTKEMKLVQQDLDQPAPQDNIPVIEIKDLSFNYGKSEFGIDDINLRIRQGEFVAIVGQNGSGKTTLAKLLCGLYYPKHGQIKIQNEDIMDWNRKEIAFKIGYVFQNPDHQIFCETVSEEVSFALRNFHYPEEEIRQRTEQALKLTGLSGYEGRDPFSLTRGEKQRLAVATVLAMEPKIIILDEPTTGLDYHQIRTIMETIQALNQKGRTIIIITHAMWVVAEYAKRVIVMDQGRIALDLPTRQALAREEELKKFYLEPPQITRLGNQFGLKVLTVEELKQCISI